MERAQLGGSKYLADFSLAKPSTFAMSSSTIQLVIVGIGNGVEIGELNRDYNFSKPENFRLIPVGVCIEVHCLYLGVSKPTDRSMGNKNIFLVLKTC